MNIINPYRFGVATTPIPLENIISEYKFENNVLDTVGTNDGTATSLTYASGLVGQTGVFNGSNSKVALSRTPSFKIGTSPFSVSFLFKLDIIETVWFFNKIDLFDTTVEYYFIYDHSTTSIYGVLYDKNSGVPLDNNGGVVSLSTNTWYHLTFTWDGGNTSGSFNIYKDGVFLSTNVTVSNFSSVVSGNSEATIGMSNHSVNTFLDGNMDCVRIWDKELSQAEVTEIATQELNGIDINP